MHPLTSPPARVLAVLAIAAGLTTPAVALDSACVRAISQANLKMINAPAFHSTKLFSGTRLDMIKVDGKLYMRMGAERWAPAQVSLQDLRDAVPQAEALVQSCQRAGQDTVNGIPTDVYRFTVKDPSAGVIQAQVWIGTRDGLPHREDSSTVKSSTSYANVKAPL